jgi:hypothetical protein
MNFARRDCWCLLSTLLLLHLGSPVTAAPSHLAVLDADQCFCTEPSPTAAQWPKSCHALALDCSGVGYIDLDLTTIDLTNCDAGESTPMLACPGDPTTSVGWAATAEQEGVCLCPEGRLGSNCQLDSMSRCASPGMRLVGLTHWDDSGYRAGVNDKRAECTVHYDSKTQLLALRGHRAQLTMQSVPEPSLQLELYSRRQLKPPNDQFCSPVVKFWSCNVTQCQVREHIQYALCIE